MYVLDSLDLLGEKESLDLIDQSFLIKEGLGDLPLIVVCRRV